MLDQLFRDIDANWRGSLAVAGRPLSIDDPHALPPVRGDATALRHALDVLLDNALNHGAGEVHIGHRVGGHTVTLTVTDEGPGFTGPGTVAAPDSPSAKSSPHGLGLPLARRLVEALPGRLVISRTSPNPRIQIVLERADSPPT
jgi:signal transduction histidine kinase